MKYRIIIFFIALALPVLIKAQPAKKVAAKQKTAVPSDINKMMEEAMKDLSPEEKKQVQEGMKMVEAMQKKGNIPTAYSLKIPRKQTIRLNKIPILRSQQQYNDYVQMLLADCKKNIQASITKEID